MQPIKKYLKEIDWVFLCFLVIFLNQSTFSLKIAGILFVYVARPNFRLRLFGDAIPKFYPLIIAVSVINFVFIRDFSAGYLAAFAVSAALWVFSILAFHQINLFVDRNGAKSISTMRAFTLLNFLMSIYQLVKVIRITEKINPYRGLDFPYGLSTGDNIYGVLLQNSLFNVMICSLLAIYFLYRKDFLFCLLAVLPVVLVFSNTGTLVLIGILILIFFCTVIYRLRSRNAQLVQTFFAQITPPGRAHLWIPVIIAVILGLSWLISPENISYTAKSIWTKVHQDVDDQDKEKLKSLDATTDSIRKQYKDARTQPMAVDTTVLASSYKEIMSEKEQMSQQYLNNFKGKKLSFVETFDYLVSSPKRLLLGAGPVRFSSITAQRMCGYDSSRLFMKVLPRFASKEYSENHMLIIKVRRESGPEYRSSVNWPDSFYNQIFGEYGVIGFILFLVFYAGFFAKKFRRWSYGIWLSALLIWFGLFSYLFETFSVVIIYELLMQLDVKQNANTATAGDGINAGV